MMNPIEISVFIRDVISTQKYQKVSLGVRLTVLKCVDSSVYVIADSLELELG